MELSNLFLQVRDTAEIVDVVWVFYIDRRDSIWQLSWWATTGSSSLGSGFDRLRLLLRLLCLNWPLLAWSRLTLGSHWLSLIGTCWLLGSLGSCRFCCSNFFQSFKGGKDRPNYHLCSLHLLELFAPSCLVDHETDSQPGSLNSDMFLNERAWPETCERQRLSLQVVLPKELLLLDSEIDFSVFKIMEHLW